MCTRLGILCGMSKQLNMYCKQLNAPFSQNPLLSYISTAHISYFLTIRQTSWWSRCHWHEKELLLVKVFHTNFQSFFCLKSEHHQPLSQGVNWGRPVSPHRGIFKEQTSAYHGSTWGLKCIWTEERTKKSKEISNGLPLLLPYLSGTDNPDKTGPPTISPIPTWTVWTVKNPPHWCQMKERIRGRADCRHIGPTTQLHPQTPFILSPFFLTSLLPALPLTRALPWRPPNSCRRPTIRSAHKLQTGQSQLEPNFKILALKHSFGYKCNRIIFITYNPYFSG